MYLYTLNGFEILDHGNVEITKDGYVAGSPHVEPCPLEDIGEAYILNKEPIKDMNFDKFMGISLGYIYD